MPTIEIDLENYIYLAHLRKKFGTFNNAVRELIEENNRLKAKKIKLKTELKTEQDFLKQAHMAAVSRPIIIGQSQAQTSMPMQQNLTPPPKVPFIESKTIKELEPSENLEQDFKDEAKILFTGTAKSPSQILKLCNPPHIDSEIDEIKKKDIPKLANTSHIVSLIKSNNGYNKFKKEIKL